MVSASINFKLAMFYLLAALMFRAVGFILKGIFNEASIVLFVSFCTLSAIFLIMSGYKNILHLFTQ